MSSNNILMKVESKIAVITINRPEKKNALNMTMYKAITKALNEASDRDDVGMTVITGTGDFYSSGNDLSAALLADNMTDYIENGTAQIRNFVEAFITHKKVLVALVNGPAVGIAVTTLPLCDIVYCTPNAWFQTPFTKLGICAEGCSSYTFPKIMGYSKANEMLLFNRKINATEAVDRGIVARIIPTEKLESQVWDMLRENAAQLSGKSLAASKRLLRRFDESVLHEANRTECRELKTLFYSDEMRESFMRVMSQRNKM